MNLVPDVAVLFTSDGGDKRLDFRSVPFVAWQQLKQVVGFTPKTLIEALGQFDLDAVCAVLWLERVQRDRRLSYGDVVKALGDETEFELSDILTGGRSLYGEEPKASTGEDPTGGSN